MVQLLLFFPVEDSGEDSYEEQEDPLVPLSPCSVSCGGGTQAWGCSSKTCNKGNTFQVQSQSITLSSLEHVNI
jgi:hypothetical protein